MSLHCLSLTFLLSCIFGEKGVAGINGREVEKEERCKDFNVHMEAVVWGGGGTHSKMEELGLLSGKLEALCLWPVQILFTV